MGSLSGVLLLEIVITDPVNSDGADMFMQSHALFSLHARIKIDLWKKKKI